MNSVRDSGTHQLLTLGSLPETHSDWEIGHDFSVSEMKFDFEFSSKMKRGERVSPAPGSFYQPRLALPGGLVFTEANRSYPWTMYAPKHTPMTLDYIFVANGCVEREIPVIEERVLQGEGGVDGIPNATVASDHIAVVVELRF